MMTLRASLSRGPSSTQSRARLTTSRFRVTADTFDSDFSTALAVYSGPPGAGFADLAAVGCTDDPVLLGANITFAGAAGTTYYFQVAGTDGATGIVAFNLRQALPPRTTIWPQPLRRSILSVCPARIVDYICVTLPVFGIVARMVKFLP